MASAAFYKMEPVPASNVNWKTTLAGDVKQLLGDAAHFGGAYARALLSDNRQFFVPVTGRPTKPDTSSSWTHGNGTKYILALVNKLLTKVDAKDIGITTMYSEDKARLTEMLGSSDMSDVEVQEQVEVATVDSFRGREKKIIIVHFVAAFDGEDPFGFVAQPNRLCFATTRAKEFMFLVGNLAHWEHRFFESAPRGKLTQRSRDLGNRNAAMKLIVKYVRENMQVVQPQWYENGVKVTA